MGDLWFRKFSLDRFLVLNRNCYGLNIVFYYLLVLSRVGDDIYLLFRLLVIILTFMGDIDN